MDPGLLVVTTDVEKPVLVVVLPGFVIVVPELLVITLVTVATFAA